MGGPNGMTDHRDPHQRPPERIKAVYKKYQKMKSRELLLDADLIHVPQQGQPPPSNTKLRLARHIQKEELHAAFTAFAGADAPPFADMHRLSTIGVYEHEDMPGLHIIPSLLHSSTQLTLLSRLLHRDLSSPSHLTNIHTHYTLTYPTPSSSPPQAPSFFTIPHASTHPIALPLSPTLHRPLPISSLLDKKLRWTTLGGQYNWTLKSYPSSPPPPFPPDTKALLERLFPETKAEAAIINLYSPGDTLSLHRDVAEQCGRGLVGVNLGCDGIFVIGTSDAPDPDTESNEKGGVGNKVLTLRLQSGSAVYMSGPARFAWHGVPQIVAGTCPEYLADWPAGSGSGDAAEYEDWRGWMRGKRVNLNVRQMWD